MERIKKSLEISTGVYDAVKSRFCLGMSEKDIKDIILKVSSGSGFGGDIVAGVRSSYIEGDATDYVLKKGDTLILDLQFNANGMWCDTTRTFFIHDVSDKALKAYDAILSAKYAGEKNLAPGALACDIYRAVKEDFGNYGKFFPHHAGHLFGTDTVIQPQFLPEKKQQLKIGDTVTLEPGLYFEGEFGIRVEDNYLITENGFENLFNYTTNIEDFIL